MSLTNALIRVEDVTARLGITDDDDSTTLEPAIQAASDAIYIACGQQFWKTTTASARIYTPTTQTYARVDPFHTTTDLVVKTDDDDDGVYETTWAASGYELDVFGGGMSNMMTAPYDLIRGVGQIFPVGGQRRRSLQVTAQWGWLAIPTPVVEAGKILAVDLWKRKDVAFGIATSTVEFGGLRISRDLMTQVASLIGPYRRMDRTLGFA